VRRSDLIGAAIGNYTIVRKLGAGGMGEVYEAQQPAIGARVAIKVLHADATDPASAQRFLIEAQAVNRIQHDGVVKVIDAGYTGDGRPYLVMEYLDGASLAEVMRGEKKIGMGTACRIIADVLAVLADAHAEDVVHRDLKPHNIFLTRGGRTVVLDFGVAKLLDTGSSVSLTLTGATLGTPAYMAPEQIQGEAVDGRTDLYTTGVVLYELVTGRKPFEGDHTYELMSAHVERRPPPPRAIRPDLPVEVQAVLMAALAKDRDDRFQTADAMRAALLQAASTLPAAMFTPIVLPGIAVRRTPTVPPSGSGPLAQASPELAATTVPMPVRGVADRTSGPTRGIGPASDPTVKGKTGPAVPVAPAVAMRMAGMADTTRAGGAATRLDDPMAATVPEGSAQMSGHGLPPPPGASTAVPRSRGPLVLFAIAIGAAAVFAAFVIGRFVGSQDKPARTPLTAAGSGAVDAAPPPPPPADAAPVAPKVVPKPIEDRLFRNHLDVADLPPHVIEALAAAERTGNALSALEGQLPSLLAAIDALSLAGAELEAKLRRVEALHAASTLSQRTMDGVADLIATARRHIGDGNEAGANDQLWRAEWILEHDGRPPPR
jgi:predicted Ser/Thr protein kinase